MTIFNQRFRLAYEASGRSYAEIARLLTKMGYKRSRQAVGGWARTETQPEREIIQALAVILQREPHWLAPDVFQQTNIVEGLPLRGKIAAGVWHEVIENQDTDAPPTPVAPDSRYPIDAQYVLEVEGNSVNRHARHGALITCVDHSATEARAGDLVVVERQRGGLVERTVKRLRSVNGALELWPVSDDPAHQEKLAIGPQNGDTRVLIRAVVIGVYERIPRGA